MHFCTNVDPFCLNFIKKLEYKLYFCTCTWHDPFCLNFIRKLLYKYSNIRMTSGIYVMEMDDLRYVFTVLYMILNYRKHVVLASSHVIGTDTFLKQWPW